MSEEGELAAARAMNASLLGEYQGLAKELALLRERYEDLERALAQARAECQQIRDLLAAERGDIDPASLALARRLTALSGRMPRATAAARAVVRKGREVKRGLIDRG